MLVSSNLAAVRYEILTILSVMVPYRSIALTTAADQHVVVIDYLYIWRRSRDTVGRQESVCVSVSSRPDICTPGRPPRTPVDPKNLLSRTHAPAPENNHHHKRKLGKIIARTRVRGSEHLGLGYSPRTARGGAGVGMEEED